MDFWWWATRLVWMFLGSIITFVIVGVLAVASQASRCEECLLYEQFIEKRNKAVWNGMQQPGCGYYPGSCSDPRD